MNAITDAVKTGVATPESIQDEAVRLVDRLRQSLHQAAREGKLNDEVADGIAYSFVGANSGLHPAHALTAFARAIEEETRQRCTAPVQDCGNPMGQNNVPSCAENTLRRHEDIAAAALARSLVSGPWPLF